jgi:hypothetical protein
MPGVIPKGYEKQFTSVKQIALGLKVTFAI